MQTKTLLVILSVVLTGFLSAPVLAGSRPLEEARALFAEQQYDKTIALVKDEMIKSGESADLLVLMADSYLALGEERTAEKIYRQALDLDSRHVDGNLNLGMLLVAERERNEAIALIKKVLADNPDHARAHFCLGIAYNARADIDDAFGQYKILKKLDKDLASELYNVIFLK